MAEVRATCNRVFTRSPTYPIPDTRTRGATRAVDCRKKACRPISIAPMSSVTLNHDGGDPAPLTGPDGLPVRVAPLGMRRRGLSARSCLSWRFRDSDSSPASSSTSNSSIIRTCSVTCSRSNVALGALFWTLIHHVVDAGWSVGLPPGLREHQSGDHSPRGLARPDPDRDLHGQPLRLVRLHPRPGTRRGSLKHLWQVKSLFFSTPLFLFRLCLYFGVWIAYSRAMRKWSVEQDRVGGGTLTLRMQWWAPSGVILLALTTTFFAFDALMSLQYTWFSTIFGVYFWAGGLRGSLALSVLVVLALRYADYLRHAITVEHLHDVAQLMFGFTVFWAYIAFGSIS